MPKKRYGPYQVVVTARVDFDFSPLELEEVLQSILKHTGDENVDKHFEFTVKCIPVEG